MDSGRGDMNGTPVAINGNPKRSTGPLGSHRILLTIVGIGVLLISAIAFATRSDDGQEGDSKAGGTGTAPFPHSRSGAQSAAANYAATLGGRDMFDKDARHRLVRHLMDPQVENKFQTGLDEDYSPELNRKIGLTADGKAPKGTTFVNQTMPAGTKVKDYSSATATVAVWCSGVLGVAGEGKKAPSANWFTMNLTLTWTDGTWKVRDFEQTDGPTPAAADKPASPSQDIGRTVEEYEGLTYTQ